MSDILNKEDKNIIDLLNNNESAKELGLEIKEGDNVIFVIHSLYPTIRTFKVKEEWYSSMYKIGLRLENIKELEKTIRNCEIFRIECHNNNFEIYMNI